MKTKMKIATAALIVIAAGSAIGVAPAKAAGIELDRVDITFKREDTEAHYGPHGGHMPPPPHYGEPRGPHGHMPPPPPHHGEPGGPHGFMPPEPHRGGHMPPPQHYGEPRGPHGGHMPPPPPYGGPHGPHGR